MCSHYQAPQDRKFFISHFGVNPPEDMGKHDVWPGYPATFIRKANQQQPIDTFNTKKEALTGLFGLVPHWATDVMIGRRTYNARTETVATKPSFRDAWRNAQHCIIPAEAFFEPDWRSGKAVPSRISTNNEEPMGIAGLWSEWKSPKGIVYSFTMLTINANDHPLMCQFHKPVDEKRMVVILPPERYDDWLNATAAQSSDYLRQFPAEILTSHSEEKIQQSTLF